MAPEIAGVHRTPKSPESDKAAVREIWLAMARLYYDPKKKLKVPAIAAAFGVSDQTVRNRIRDVLAMEGPEINEIRRMAFHSKRRIKYQFEP